MSWSRQILAFQKRVLQDIVIIDNSCRHNSGDFKPGIPWVTKINSGHIILDRLTQSTYHVSPQNVRNNQNHRLRKGSIRRF